MKNTQDAGNIVIFEDKAGHIYLDVRLDHDTVWLNRQQMAQLFDRDIKTIGKHINTALIEELQDVPTVAKFATVQMEGKRAVERKVEHYNLDMIISVGYRVNSHRGVQFRRWANTVLKNYLINGYVIKERLHNEQLQHLQHTVKLLGHITQNYELTLNEATGLLKVIADYAYGLDVLDKYDNQALVIEKTTTAEQFKINYAEAKTIIDQLRSKFGAGALFGHEKDQSFQSSISTIYQTFEGKDLYPSIEEKAAHLLYFVVKNHSFSDGNKRIAASLFLCFLEKNYLLYTSSGEKRIADNALVALTLMIAESKTEEMDTMIKVVVNLINKNN